MSPIPLRPWSRAALFACLAVSLVPVAARPVARPGPDAPAAPPAGAWRVEVQRAIEAAEYEATRAGGVLQAPNRATGLRARFRAGGVEVTRREVPAAGTAAHAWRWETAGLGRAGAMAAAAPVEPVADRGRVTYAHEGWSEWYANTPAGLEQGFTIARRPAGEGPLRIEAAVAHAGGPRVDEDGRAVRWSADGRPAFESIGLHAFDAAHAPLPARFEVDGARVAIVVDDRGARYPIVVDPVLGFPAAPVTSGLDGGPWMGWSVSGAGDVNGDGYGDLIVGAPKADVGGANRGRAWCFHGGAAGLSTTAAWARDGAIDGAEYGWEVSALGDVNGDGYDDVAIGSPGGETSGGVTGLVHVFYGSAAGLGASPVTFIGSAPGERFGQNVAHAGDLNGDGYDDVLMGGAVAAYAYLGGASGVATVLWWRGVGSPESTVEGIGLAGGGDVNGDGYDDIALGEGARQVSVAGEGVVSVYLGGATPPSLSTPDWLLASGVAGAHVGSDVAVVGDVNGDGYADVAAVDGVSSTPRAFLFAGGPAAPAAPAWSATYPAGFAFTSCASAGDTDGDGYADLAVGFTAHANGQAGEGAVLLYRGRAGGLAAAADATLEVNQASASLGTDVSCADVNGDGLSDVIGAAYQYDATYVDEGAVFVFAGTGTRALAASGWVREGNEPGANLAAAIAHAGDVNGDGFSDVAVGAPDYDHGGVAGAGRVSLYLGGPGGPGAAPQRMLGGGQANAHFGAALAGAGDVNGDGYDDLVVGAPDHDTTLEGEGRAQVFPGGPAGLGATAIWTREGGVAGARFGATVAGGGDVNADGFHDVFVGAPSLTNGQALEGYAAVFLGGAAGPEASPQWSREGSMVFAYSGTALATGDVDGDGYDDFVIGSPGASLGESAEGVVHVFYGSASGIQTVGFDLLDNDQASASFGRSVACGDVNGDGYADVVVGSPFHDFSLASQGTVRVHYGGPGGAQGTAAWAHTGTQQNEYVGWAVAYLGDVNRDGFGDIALGLPGRDGAAGADAGRVLVAYGTATYPSLASGFVVDGAAAEEELGLSVAPAGDVNGDGAMDLLAGSPHFTGGQAGEGRVQLFLGGDLGGAAAPLAQRRADESALALGGGAPAAPAPRLAVARRTAGGRDRVRIQYQFEPLLTPFAGAPVRNRPWADMTAAGWDVESFTPAVVLAPGEAYHWRARVKAKSPWFRHSPWRSLPGVGEDQAHLRTLDATLAVGPGTPAAGLALAAPAPNPSAGEVALAFTLPAGGSARFEVLDAAGRRVATLADGEHAPGTHRLAWTGAGDDGSPVAPGVYFARLVAGGQARSVRLVRIR